MPSKLQFIIPKHHQQQVPHNHRTPHDDVTQIPPHLINDRQPYTFTYDRQSRTYIHTLVTHPSNDRDLRCLTSESSWYRLHIRNRIRCWHLFKFPGICTSKWKTFFVKKKAFFENFSKMYDREKVKDAESHPRKEKERNLKGFLNGKKIIK